MAKIIWLTGLSGAGKSTIAYALQKKIMSSVVLDGDSLRKCFVVGFSESDRRQYLKSISALALEFQSQGITVICSLISPYRDIRNEFKQNTGVIEVYVKASLDCCIKRDVKGLYAKALRGEIENFTGISAPYEEPTTPHLVIDTEVMSIDDSVDLILYYLFKYAE